MGLLKKAKKLVKKTGKTFDKNIVQRTIKPVKKPVKKVLTQAEKHGLSFSPGYHTSNGPKVDINYKGIPVRIDKNTLPTKKPTPYPKR